MKRAFCIIAPLTFLFFLCTSGLTAGPKSFEGVITFKITYPDSKFTESQLANFPKIFTITIKGNKSKTEMKVMGSTQIEITDYQEKSKVALIDMMGQKYAVKSTGDEIAKELAKEPAATVEVTGETKSIAGYTCKKAVVTVNDDGAKSTYDVYYTSDLGPKAANFDNPLYKDIDGVLLEFSMKTPQFTMVFSATSVEKKSVSSKEFEVPADFTPVTKEELQSKFGGMGQ
jgi:GLPGLI family protein